ncbi:serine hydrolase domain-containing protein [Rhodococcus sp. TAF43]|uniref:serine hydrolase domain-containing protein n=1 Tax=unclassified Rhodococcus (in: high G+C Gram-positive bacteria) TaxID=192944 RepID=UPI0015835B2B|nr:serine hydrolase domain-containing protein [Rhodococcus sp. W8901]QKT11129.1 beta-lactamase family protein [Rhodococcus sp. W8901]
MPNGLDIRVRGVDVRSRFDTGTGIRVACGALVAALAIAGCSSGDSGSGETASSSATSSSTASATTTVALQKIDAATLNETVASMAKDLQVPGAVAILKMPGGDLTATYGTGKLGASTAVTTVDHIRIGSNTKTMTGTVILQLVQEGKIALTDPVSKYRPDVPNGDNITIEQLLDMRSGLFNYTETAELNETLDNDPQKQWKPDDLLAIGFANPPYFPPGQGYHYSNTNIVLLGLIAESLDGKPLPQIFQSRLFGPLGLTGTSFPDTADSSIPAPHSQGYVYGTNMDTLTDPALPADMQAAAKDATLQPNDVTDVNPSWAWAAGAGISTANDLVTWVQALVGGKLLDADLQAQRLASVQPTGPDSASAQYGWGIAKMGPMFGHTGELPGFNSFMGHDPENKVTLVVWTNLAPAANGQDPATTMAKEIIGKVYPA